MTYIHYGSDHFDPALFDPVRNGGLEYGFRPKPADGTGLWASREGDPNGWEAWCRGARFNLDALSHSFRFTMQGAKILLLEDPAQLITLPKLHIASRKVLEKNDFVQEGLQRNAVFKDDKVYDLCVYGKLK